MCPDLRNYRFWNSHQIVVSEALGVGESIQKEGPQNEKIEGLRIDCLKTP